MGCTSHQYPASNDQSEKRGLVQQEDKHFARKAAIIMAGTAHVWLPPASGVRCISGLERRRINDVFIEQKEVGRQGRIAGHVELDADKDMNGSVGHDNGWGYGRAWRGKRIWSEAPIGWPLILSSMPRWVGVMNWGSLSLSFQKWISLQVGNCWTLKTERWVYALLKVVHQPDKDGHISI